jgi:hypothetical protein
MIRKIIPSLPVITLLILIIGIIKQLVYYNYFKLPIKHFLTINEISSLIAEDILNYAWMVFSLITIRILGDDVYQRYLEKIKTRKNKGTIYIIPALLCLIILIWMIFERRYYYQIILSSSMAFLTTLAVLDSEPGRKLASKFNDLYMAPIIILVICFEMQVVSSEISKVIKGKYYGTKIYTNETILTSDPNSYYIGQTEKYIFLYSKEKTITILPSSEVQKVEMKIR